MKVENIIIGKQFENSENYKEFSNIIKEKNIQVYIVISRQKINIEKDLYLNVLWPDQENIIRENVLNNNSLVFKLMYKEISILFTGDIEETAEKAILEKYKNSTNILQSTILKVAHHGSKTSTTQDFLNTVKPQIALIGVGENNMFGHPSNEVIKRLENIKTKIYRTDMNGEISIRVDQNERVWIDKMLN